MFSKYFEQFALSTVLRFVFACLAHSSKAVFSVIYKFVPIILTYRLKFNFNMTYAVKHFVKKKMWHSVSSLILQFEEMKTYICAI